MKYMLFITALSLSACQTIKSAEEIAPNTYRIHFVDTDIAQSPAAGAAAGDMFALEKCPNGYEKIKEQVVPKNGSREYTWTVKCIKVD